VNVDELLALDRELTDEEFLFLEAELLKTVHELQRVTEQLLPDIDDPELAAKLKESTEDLVWATEQAAAIPLHDAPLIDSPSAEA
jgi:hypothetical protein